MQRINRLTRMAERKAERVKKKLEDNAERVARAKRITRQAKAITALNNSKRLARRQQVEDWGLGPLAPKRDVIPNYHGMLGARIMDNELLPHELDARAAWCGGRNTLCLAIGDRVVVMEGHFKGKIGKIDEINRKRMEVTLGDLTKVNIRTPDAWLVTMKDRPVTTGSISIPISWVRLVHPIMDPVTGIVRDTVIHQLVASNVSKDRPTHRSFWARVVPRGNIAIPWPPSSSSGPNAADNETTHDVDTVRIELEKNTFVPTLLRPPMPPTVINELRNYYSRYRTRHEPAWVEKKEKQDEERRLRLRYQKLSMRTPMQARNILSRLERKLVGPPQLTESMLEKIGRVIAKNRPGKLLALEAKKKQEQETQ